LIHKSQYHLRTTEKNLPFSVTFLLSDAKNSHSGAIDCCLDMKIIGNYHPGQSICQNVKVTIKMICHPISINSLITEGHQKSSITWDKQGIEWFSPLIIAGRNNCIHSKIRVKDERINNNENCLDWIKKVIGPANIQFDIQNWNCSGVEVEEIFDNFSTSNYFLNFSVSSNFYSFRHL
jgi:hypothetical protein